MTLGRLMELYKAEQEGKQIMMRTNVVGFHCSREYIEEVKISEYELNDLVITDKPGIYYDFFIKDEEDEDGNKIK